MRTAVTGIKPTGIPHLGNYLGMIRPALDLTRQHRAMYFIADLHALTIVRDGRLVRELSYQAAATWLALGLDPARSLLYRQSDVPEVAELAWILDCVTPKGLMNRAHAYKAARDANEREGRDPDAGVNMGLYNYPVLMAADILLPGADVVPVGRDQKQHIEITQDIARAFNSAYGHILRVPEACIDPNVHTVPGTDGRKMSKTYGNVIPVLGSTAEVTKAVMRIKTDSRHPEEPKDPEADSIFTLFRLVAEPAEVDALAQRYRVGGLGYGAAKQELADVLARRFQPARQRYNDILGDRTSIDRILAQGAEQVRAIGQDRMQRVREATGLGHRPSRACPQPAATL